MGICFEKINGVWGWVKKAKKDTVVTVEYEETDKLTNRIEGTLRQSQTQRDTEKKRQRETAEKIETERETERQNRILQK